jgi:sensor histidine kinase YesM
MSQEESNLLKYLNPDCIPNTTDMIHVDGHPAVFETRKTLVSCSKTKALFAVGVHVIIIIILVVVTATGIISTMTAIIIISIVAVSAIVSYFITISGPWSSLVKYNNEVKELTASFRALYGENKKDWSDWSSDEQAYINAKEKAMSREIDKDRNVALSNQNRQPSMTENLASKGISSLFSRITNNKQKGGDYDGDDNNVDIHGF